MPRKKFRSNTKRLPKIGVIGLGYWGKNILRNLYDLKILHTACDIDPRVIEEKEREFQGVNYTTVFEKVLTNTNLWNQE